MSLRVEGMEDLIRTLKKMEGAAQADVLADACHDAMEPVRSRAAQLAPRRTGRLRRGILKKVEEKRAGYAAVDVGPEKDDFYARFIEKGWRPAGRSKSTKHTTLGINKSGRERKGGLWQGMKIVPPRPFLRPATDEQKDAVFAFFRHNLIRWFDSIR